MWPSAQRDAAEEEKSSEESEEEAKPTLASFWPSQQEAKAKEDSRQAKKNVKLEDYSDHDDQAEEVDWLAIPIKKEKPLQPQTSSFDE